MAFVFLVETGVGLAGATSYISVDAADTYMEVDRANSAAWSALSDENKEYYLSWSSRILDQKTEWEGCKTVDTSALRWPRKGVVDRDGITLADNVVPTAVKAATVEFAKYLLTNDPTKGADTDQLKSVTIDVIELVFQDQTSQSSFPSIINAILLGLGHLRAGLRGFGRIRKA